MKAILTIISAFVLNALTAQDTLLLMTITPMEGYETEAATVAGELGFSSCGYGYCIELEWKWDNALAQHNAVSSGYFSNVVSVAPEPEEMPTRIGENKSVMVESRVYSPYTLQLLKIVRDGNPAVPDEGGFYIIHDTYSDKRVVIRKVFR